MEPDALLEMQYEDRFYIPDEDEFSEEYNVAEECLDCWELIDDEGLCACTD